MFCTGLPCEGPCFFLPPCFLFPAVVYGKLFYNPSGNLFFMVTSLEQFLQDLLKEAGQICLSEQENLTAGDIEFKNQKDIVTATDKKVENLVISRIKARFPGHDILGEETGRHCSPDNKDRYLWVIDPIDGTTSFYHNQPFYSVSIALQKQGQTILGGVLAPALGQMFTAQKGHGAVLNGHPITVSSRRNLIESVMATGFACLRAGREPNNLVHFNRIVPQLRDIRRYGSAALDLCYTAAGKLDGFWEMELNLYDIAAGALIAGEAGALVTDFSGGNQYPEQGIVAANPVLSRLLIDLLNPKH